MKDSWPSKSEKCKSLGSEFYKNTTTKLKESEYYEVYMNVEDVSDIESQISRNQVMINYFGDDENNSISSFAESIISDKHSIRH